MLPSPTGGQRLNPSLGSVGIHPNHAQGRQKVQEDMEALGRILEGNSKVVAVGETGLNLRCDCEEQCPEFWDQNALELQDQQEYFTAQFRLARKLGKPVVVRTPGKAAGSHKLPHMHV